MEIGFIIFLILWSLAAGGIARWAVPGPDPMGILETLALGFGGSLLGGLLAWFLLARWGGFLFAILGSVLLLIAYRKVVQKRPITGAGAKQLPPRS